MRKTEGRGNKKRGARQGSNPRPQNQKKKKKKSMRSTGIEPAPPTQRKGVLPGGGGDLGANFNGATGFSGFFSSSTTSPLSAASFFCLAMSSPKKSVPPVDGFIFNFTGGKY